MLNAEKDTLDKIKKAVKILKANPSPKIIRAQISLLYKYKDLPEARRELAIEFHEGNFKTTPNIAFTYALEAAQNGDHRNFVNVGYCYAEGMGTKKNFKEAIKWFLKASRYGHAEAYYNLAKHYEFGQGVKLSPKKAFKFYELAASVENNSEFNLALGWCYEHGFGIKRDIKIAVKYYRKAAKQGNEMARKNLLLMLSKSTEN